MNDDRRLPHRTANHVLSEKSDRFLQQALPPEWLLRGTGENIEYGVDKEVEIFVPPEEGNEEADLLADGTTFVVQLKSRGKRSSDQNLTDSIKVSTLNYLRQRFEPVLLVLYMEATDHAYGLWLHRLDFSHKQLEQKTITINWNSGFAITESTSEELRIEAQRFRLVNIVRQRRSTPTVQIDLRSLSDQRLEKLVTTDIKSCGMNVSEPGRETVELKLTADTTSITIDGVITSARIPCNTTALDSKTFAGTALAMLSDCLRRLGHNPLARTASLFSKHGLLWGNTDFVSRTVSDFIQSRDLARLRRVPQMIDLEPTYLGAYIALDHAQSIPLDSLLEGEPELLSAALSAFLTPDANDPQDNKREAEHNKEMAAACCSIAMFQGYLGCYDDADVNYQRAATLDPEYWERDHFVASIAANLFEQGRFLDAIPFYSAAMEMANPKIRPFHAVRLADTFAHVGYIEESAFLFSEFAASLDWPDNCIWELKARCLEAFICPLNTESSRSQQNQITGIPTTRVSPVAQKYIEDSEEMLTDSPCGVNVAFGVAFGRGQSTAEWATSFLSLVTGGNLELADLVLGSALKFRSSSILKDLSNLEDSNPSKVFQVGWDRAIERMEAFKAIPQRRTFRNLATGEQFEV